MSASALRDWLLEGGDAPNLPEVQAILLDLDAIDAAARALAGDLATLDAAAAVLGEARGVGGGEDVVPAASSRAGVGRRVADAVVSELAADERFGVGVVTATARDGVLAGVPDAVARAALARVFADEVAAGLARDRRAIDLAAGGLMALEPPADVVAAVQAAVRAEPVVAWRAPTPANTVSRGWRRALLGLVAVAAAGLLVVAARGVSPPDAPPVGDPTDWTIRGNTGPRPVVDLRLSVRGGDGAIARLRRGAAYPAGDVVLFRVDVDREAPVTLLRVDAHGVVSVWRADTAVGATDVRRGDEALGWALERGESASVFVAVAGRGVSAEQLRESLPPGDDPAGVCAAVEALGLGCAAVRVEEVR